MPEHNQGQMGGTMRLGRRRTIFKRENSILSESTLPSLLRDSLDTQFDIYSQTLWFFSGRLYGDVDHVDERHRHRYEVNPKYVEDLEKSGMIFTGQSEDGNRMEVMELGSHKYYVGVQYHPEYISRPYKPSAPYVGFVLAASGKLDSYLEKMVFNNPSRRQSLFRSDKLV